MRKIIMLIISGTCLSGCLRLTNPDGSWNSLTPHPMFLRNIPTGNDSYSQGFRAGCNDSMGLSGYGALRFHEVTWGDSLSQPLKYQYAYDANRAITDNQYSLGVGHGYGYCGVAANAVIGF